MAKIGEYEIRDIYQGGYSSLDPNKAYGSPITGYQATAGSLGLTTDPRSANIIKETSSKLSTGVKQIELTLISPKLFDAVPKQQLKEVKQLSKLTGIDVSVHGPVMDSAGMTQQGWSEVNRESSERTITDVIKRSHEIDPDGNIPVIFHTSEGIPGTEWESLEGQRKAKRMIIVDRETGKNMTSVEIEKKYYPGGKEGVREEEISAEKNLEIANSSEWNNSLRQVEFSRESAERVMQDIDPHFRELYLTAGKRKDLSSEEIEEIKKVHSAADFMQQAELSATALFDKAYSLAKRDNDQRAINHLNNLSKTYGEVLGDPKKDIRAHDPKTQSHAMFNLIEGLKQIQPKIFVPMEEFATEQSSKTFGNAAFEAYKEFGNKAPIVAIENPPFGFALSTGEDLRNLVVESRKQFVENAKKEGIGRSQAEEAAEKLIGATWDVGHINMLRKQGFGEKEIIKETEKIAPFLKHVHLSDNFGMEHTELPMGMGNVPMKKIMEKLGKKGFEARKIIEAADWWQHFQTPPVVESLEGLGASMYTTGASPTWNQRMGLYQGYMSGLEGAWLPQYNFEMSGTGFSQLPAELGGQRPGAQGGRMSGRPME